MSKRRKTSEKAQRLNLTDSLIKGLPIKDHDYTNMGSAGWSIWCVGLSLWRENLLHGDPAAWHLMSARRLPSPRIDLCGGKKNGVRKSNGGHNRPI